MHPLGGRPRKASRSCLNSERGEGRQGFLKRQNSNGGQSCSLVLKDMEIFARFQSFRSAQKVK